MGISIERVIREWVIIVLTPNKQFFSNIMTRTSYDDDCYIHKTNTLGNITLILRQPVFDFTPYCCACDAANINFIVYSFTWMGLEPTIYHSKCEHATHYIINVIKRNEILYKSKINNDRRSLNSSSKLRMSWKMQCWCIYQWLLFNTKWEVFHQYLGEKILPFNEKKKTSVLYQTIIFCRIFIVLANII
jgi:hypothetical protein